MDGWDKPCSPHGHVFLLLLCGTHHGLVRLAGWLPANSAFLSYHFSTSHQPSASQQYFSLTTNQHPPPVTSQPNEVMSQHQLWTAPWMLYRSKQYHNQFLVLTDKIEMMK
jgi:hypothetical protein